jgi:hypothetical protein
MFIFVTILTLPDRSWNERFEALLEAASFFFFFRSQISLP